MICLLTKVVIYAGGLVRVFYVQTINMSSKYAVALFTTLKFLYFNHTRVGILRGFKLTA